MELANASMLDEATAAAEAMTLLQRVNKKNRSNVSMCRGLPPPNHRGGENPGAALDIEVVVGDPDSSWRAGSLWHAAAISRALMGPGAISAPLIEKAHAAKTLVTVAADIMALLLVKSPGELGADVVVGNSSALWRAHGLRRARMPPYFATRDATSGPLRGVLSACPLTGAATRPLRMAMQTREQHIRREKATSNICTAQALLAIMAAFYAMYHGPTDCAASPNAFSDLPAYWLRV